MPGTGTMWAVSRKLIRNTPKYARPSIRSAIDGTTIRRIAGASGSTVVAIRRTICSVRLCSTSSHAGRRFVG